MTYTVSSGALNFTPTPAAGVVICLERGADLHMAQLMPLPLTVSCFSKIQIGFTFLVLAYPGSPRQRAVKRVCVCVLMNKIFIRYKTTTLEVFSLAFHFSCFDSWQIKYVLYKCSSIFSLLLASYDTVITTRPTFFFSYMKTLTPIVRALGADKVPSTSTALGVSIL